MRTRRTKAFTTSRISRRSRRATWARSGKPEGSSKASSAPSLRDRPAAYSRTSITSSLASPRCRAWRSLPGRGRQQSSRFRSRLHCLGPGHHRRVRPCAELSSGSGVPCGDVRSCAALAERSLPPHAHRLGSLLQVAAFYGIAGIGSLARALAWTPRLRRPVRWQLWRLRTDRRSRLTLPRLFDYYAGLTHVYRLVQHALSCDA